MPNCPDPTAAELARLADELGIDLAEIFRPKRAEKYFGFKKSQLHEKIKRGEIDPPVPLSDTGSAVGFSGLQVVKHHWRRLQLAAARRKEIAI
jgi:hypothetical protein